MNAEDLLRRTLRYLQKTDSLNVLAEDIEKYLAEPRKPMTEEEIDRRMEPWQLRLDMRSDARWGAGFKAGIRFAEKFHGIGGEDE